MNACQPFNLPKKGDKHSHDTSIIPKSSNSLNTSTKRPSLMKKIYLEKNSKQKKFPYVYHKNNLDSTLGCVKIQTTDCIFWH